MSPRPPVPATPALVLQQVRLRAQRLTLWMEQAWRQGLSSPDQGLAISPGEVRRLLAEPAAAAAERRAFLEADEASAAFAGPIAEADRALAADPGWQGLARAFGLSEVELELLALCVAEALDPGLQRVVAYLQDDVRQTQATPALAARLFDRDPVGAEPIEGLLRWRLATPAEGQSPWRADTGWRAEPALVLSLQAGEWRDPDLEGVVRLDPPEAERPPVVYAAALSRLQILAGEAEEPAELDILGARGSGRATLAGQLAAKLGRPLLVVDARRLLAGPRPAVEALTAVFRFARHSAALTCWRDAQELPPAEWRATRALAGLALRCGPSDGLDGSEAPRVRLPALTTQDRLAVWASHSRRPPPPILAVQRLTSAEIALAAGAAGAGPEAMREALRRVAPPRSELLIPLPCPYEWDDLIVSPELMRRLQEFEAQVRLRWSVYEDWGFERLVHLGHGISALFGGPSGSGKTMAAQVMARALELDLYRIDLAGVINKYVGETEKRLREVFDVCERAGVLLFFDEADALFGQRMQAKDSHDRFANIEIDYLLQRIERFDGVAILATNRKNDLDQAFLRRLRFIIDFMPPGPREREILWRRALPAVSPSGETITEALDWELLAERLTMTGADIKAAALGAAFLARDQGETIGMRHVLAAAQREMTKHGHVLRAPIREARP